MGSLRRDRLPAIGLIGWEVSQLEVQDVQGDRADPRLMMPSSRKGRLRPPFYGTSVEALRPALSFHLIGRKSHGDQAASLDETVILNRNCRPLIYNGINVATKVTAH
jgi:hypothetical protein